MPAPSPDIRAAIVRQCELGPRELADLRDDVMDATNASRSQVSATITAMVTEEKLWRKGSILLLPPSQRPPPPAERHKLKVAEERRQLHDRIVRMVRAFGPLTDSDLHWRLHETRIGVESTRRLLDDLAVRGSVHCIEGTWRHGPAPAPTPLPAAKAEETVMPKPKPSPKCTAETVLDALRRGDRTTAEIARRLGVTTNHVRPVVQELFGAGRVVEDGVQGLSKLWKIADEPTRYPSGTESTERPADPPAVTLEEVLTRGPQIDSEELPVVPPAGDDLDEVLTLLGWPTDLALDEVKERVTELLKSRKDLEYLLDGWRAWATGHVSAAGGPTAVPDHALRGTLEDALLDRTSKRDLMRQIARELLPLEIPGDAPDKETSLVRAVQWAVSALRSSWVRELGLEREVHAAKESLVAVEQRCGLDGDAGDSLSWRILRIGDALAALKSAPPVPAPEAMTEALPPDPKKVPVYETFLRIDMLREADVHQGSDPWCAEVWPGRRVVAMTLFEVLSRVLDEVDEHDDGWVQKAGGFGRVRGLTVIHAERVRSDVDDEPPFPAPPTTEGALVLSQAAELGRLRDLVRQLETTLRSETRRRMSAEALLRAVQAGIDDATGAESIGEGIEITIDAVAHLAADQRAEQNIASSRRALGVAS